MPDSISNPMRWYQTWWGVFLIGLLCLSIAVVLSFGAVVGYYVWKIKKGEGEEIAKQLNSAVQQKGSGMSVARKDLESTDDPTLGNPGADLVIVEFIDFKCPNCLTEDPIIRKIAQKYWEKVRIIVRDFPGESIHKGASELALLASCAHEQGKYWSLHDILFANQGSLPETLNETEVKNLLSQAGVDFDKAKQCLAGSKARAEVNRDYADGYKYQVRGTPTFFVNGQKVEGVVSYEAWEKFLGSL